MKAKESAQITQVGDELHVKCPYDESVVGDLRGIGGRWEAAARIWILPARREYIVHKIVRNRFHVDGPMPIYKGRKLTDIYGS